MFDDSDVASGMMTITRIDTIGDKQDIFKDLDFNSIDVLPTRNLILFPDITMPIGIARSVSQKIAEEASSKNKIIGVICQKDVETENPDRKDLEKYGVFARVLNVITLPNGVHTAIVQAFGKFRVIGDSTTRKDKDIISVRVKPITDIVPHGEDKEFKATVQGIKQLALQIIEKKTDGSGLELSMNLRNIDDPVLIVNSVATMFPFPHEVKLRMLIIHRLKERALTVLQELGKQGQMIDLTENIKNKALQGMQDHQKNAFLHEQLSVIREELYGDDADDSRKLYERLEVKKLADETRAQIIKEIEKLEKLNPQNPDYAVQYNYLDLLLSLPWLNYSDKRPAFKDAEAVLDSGHYGMTKVKERIIEQLAVILNNPEVKSPILCLVGPPGVGKTSIAKSVAKALEREYQRISLGGVHDEAEIRGHRRTYIGAMPGRIIDALKRVATSNPVLVLDEIDKLGSDYKGDPSAALLEVLDPEQNNHFHDNFIDIDYDLSKVLFIATANTLGRMPQPLIDRMEIIELSGYALEEKLEIAKRHIINKIREDLGLQDLDVDFSDEALETLIDEYTRESGVRQMEKQIATVLRKLLSKRLRGEDIPKMLFKEDIRKLLGVSHLGNEKYDIAGTPGVVTGLAWTSAGGDILYIESTLVPGKGEKLSITGNLGDVMKESATLALQYVKANSESLGIDSSLFEKNNVHIHVPEGAVPKDGPSAGITLVTSLVSALKNMSVKDKVAMTGEITLRGKVLPVGGIKEKILAAKRSGITSIILSEENRKDVEAIPEDFLKGLEFNYVSDINDVLSAAFDDFKLKLS